MKTTLLAIIAVGVALLGCATSNLPRGARLVGGGLDIRYNAPAAGTVILIERTSGRIVATKSLEGKGAEFYFSPSSFDNGDVIATMFSTVPGNTGEITYVPTNTFITHAPMNTFITHVPTNTFFQLYFVPAKTRRE
jgi:hypothetical protein